MRLMHLQLLLSIAQTGSLRAAADALHVSQPALTKALQQLEEEFGTTLVHRSPRGARLAQAGELLAARAALALRELDRAREEVAWHVERTHASLAIGVSPAAATMLVPSTIARFTARWPSVHIRVLDTLYPRALSKLRAGEIDIAVGPRPADDGSHDVRVEPLFASESVVVARKGHRLQNARRLAALVNAAWVLTGPTGGPGDPAKLGLWPSDGAARATPLAFESFSTLLAVVSASDYLAVVPHGFFEFYGPRLGIVRLPLHDPLPVLRVCAMWRADAPLTVPAQRLLEALLEEARRLGPRP
ncbi:MAG: LysR family transcriptional regulator [Proteobacteria bacterium]|jgi:LysR family transcriptional regulator of abg operon|nr:LysR family transcriptional regulator [Pseudomonadota bacterium]